MDVITTRELKERLGELQGREVALQGWIRNHRKQKNMGFIDFFDGTCFRNPQVVYDNQMEGFEAAQLLRVGSAVTVTGKVVPSYKDPETPEIQASSITLEGDCPEDYPLQPKRHTVEFLREIAYLRPRTRLFQAVFRVRSVAAMAIHTYFQDRGYVYVHTPLITGNDAEPPWPSPASWRAKPSPWPSRRSIPSGRRSGRRTATRKPMPPSSG